MKIGELAQRTGLTVRTLRFYDEIGLVRPTERSEGGHRMYGPEAVRRLQQVTSLRSLGLSLEEVRDLLDVHEASLLETIELQHARLSDQIAALERLRLRLDGITQLLRQGEAITTDTLVTTMEAMSMVERYYSAEQLEWLRKRREEIGEERIQEVEAKWPKLIAEVRAKMDAGVDPGDAEVQELVVRWQGLIAEFTGGNPEIRQSLQNFYDNEDTMPTGESIDKELFAYVGQAMQATGSQD